MDVEVDGVGKGRWRGARREAHGWGGKMEGSETGGTWVGTGGGKMEGSETGGADGAGGGEGR